ncbi:MAG: sigma-70 family RNA polymerase sigma factor [Candidatus Margulisbacteria bacterium]|nr:sigma-70 family RNA polymerase sigma factor [Candidatus Margulisiibacteriota bacterium]
MSFSQIYDEQKSMVWGLVSRYVPLKQDREDLYQEVFLKVFRSLKHFRGEASVKTWVYRITVNTSLSYLKKKKRNEALMSALSVFNVFSADDKQIELDEDVFKPLGKLNPRQRMVLILADIEDQSLDNIADMLNVPVGTVKSNLHRAREIVKKELEKNG